jgi:hypothetical protein
MKEIREVVAIQKHYRPRVAQEQHVARRYVRAEPNEDAPDGWWDHAEDLGFGTFDRCSLTATRYCHEHPSAIMVVGLPVSVLGNPYGDGRAVAKLNLDALRESLRNKAAAAMSDFWHTPAERDAERDRAWAIAREYTEAERRIFPAYEANEAECEGLFESNARWCRRKLRERVDEVDVDSSTYALANAREVIIAEIDRFVPSS